MRAEDHPEKTVGLLLSVSSLVTRRLAEVATGAGITTPGLVIIGDVAEHPGTTLQEIVERLGLPKSSTSWAVDDLVRKGFLKRETPPHNRRVVQISLADIRNCPTIGWQEILPGAGADGGTDWSGIEDALSQIQKLLKK